jgi:hypothetical protein
MNRKLRCPDCARAANTRVRRHSRDRTDDAPEVIEARYAEAVARLKAAHLRLAEEDVWGQSGRWREFVSRNTPDTTGLS